MFIFYTVVHSVQCTYVNMYLYFFGNQIFLQMYKRLSTQSLMNNELNTKFVLSLQGFTSKFRGFAIN